MVKKLLISSIFIVQSNLLFAGTNRELKITDMNEKEPIALMSTNGEIPGNSVPTNSLVPYTDILTNPINKYLNHIITSTSLKETRLQFVNVYKYNKFVDFSWKHYIVINFENAQSYRFKNLSFEWKKKTFGNLNSFELPIARYYYANNESKIKFLYAWGRPNSQPWAIKLNDQIHSTIWVRTAIKELNNIDPIDSFLTLNPSEENVSNYLLLVDETNKPIAKSTNQGIVFRNEITKNLSYN